MTGTMMGSELEEIVLCMSREGVHGEVRTYAHSRQGSLPLTHERQYAYCTLETMDKRKVVCVCVLLQGTHN